MTHIAPLRPMEDTGDLLREGFALARDRIRKEIRAEESGFVLVAALAASGDVVGWRLPASERGQLQSVVVGRHDAADLVLASDGALSLRHVMILLSHDPEGRPVVRVLDLRSGTGMHDASGCPHYSLVSNGPVALRVGNTALFALPAGEELDPWAEGDGFDDIDWPMPITWIPHEPPERHITAVSKVTHISTVVSMPPATADRRGGGGRLMRGSRAGKVSIEAGGGRFDMDVGTVDLRTGLMIGRYPRCDLNVEMTDLPQTVSRVHALLLMVNNRVHAFDTGSTNGLQYEGFPIRSMVLAEHQPSRLVIDESVSLTWWPA